MNYANALIHFGGIFDFDEKQRRLQEVKRELEDPEVWKNLEKAQELGKERAQLENIVDGLSKISARLSDAGELLDIAKSEEDESLFLEIKNDVDDVCTHVEKLE